MVLEDDKGKENCFDPEDNAAMEALERIVGKTTELKCFGSTAFEDMPEYQPGYKTPPTDPSSKQS